MPVVRAKDAETLVRTPGLALWEEKVLSLRGNRSNKHRNLLLERRDRLVDGVVKEEVQEVAIRYTEEKEDVETPIAEEETISLQERLLRAFLTCDDAQTCPPEKCVPTCDSLVHIEEEASLSENDEQANIDASSDSDDGVQNISADSRATTPQPQRF